MGTAGGRRGGVPVEDEQDGGGKSTTSRTGGARVGDEQGTSLDEQGRSRTGGQEEEDRRRGRPNLVRGRANGAALPPNPSARLGLVAARELGCAGIPPTL